MGIEYKLPLIAVKNVEISKSFYGSLFGQSVFRVFNPDGHIIEIGESMAHIAKRFLSEGKTP